MKQEDVRAIVKETVHETLMTLGVDIHDASQVQQDMAHIRKLRLGCEATKRNIIRAFLTVSVPSAVYIFWETFKHIIKGVIGVVK